MVPNHNTTTYDPEDTYNNVTLKYLIVKNGPKNGQNGGISATNRKYRQAYTKKKTTGDSAAAPNADAAFAMDGSLQDLGPLDSEPLMDYFGAAASGGGGIAFSQEFGYDPSMFGSIMNEGDMMPHMTGGSGSSSGGGGAGSKRVLSGPDGAPLTEGGSPAATAPKKRKTASKKATATSAAAAALPVVGSPSQAMIPGSQGKLVEVLL